MAVWSDIYLLSLVVSCALISQREYAMLGGSHSCKKYFFAAVSGRANVNNTKRNACELCGTRSMHPFIEIMTMKTKKYKCVVSTFILLVAGNCLNFSQIKEDIDTHFYQPEIRRR